VTFYSIGVREMDVFFVPLHWGEAGEGLVDEASSCSN